MKAKQPPALDRLNAAQATSVHKAMKRIRDHVAEPWFEHWFEHIVQGGRSKDHVGKAF